MHTQSSEFNSNNPYPVNIAYTSQSYSNKAIPKFNYSQSNINTISQKIKQKSTNNHYQTNQNYLNQSQVINNSSNVIKNSSYINGSKSHSSTLILSKNSDSQVSQNNKNQSYAQNSGEISTKILHQKIHYLQRQLHQLTKLLQQQSRMSQSGSNYQELAIENAQLTIKVQQLEQQIKNNKHKKEKTSQEVKQIIQQLQKEHQTNKKLRQMILECQNKISKLQQQKKEGDYSNLQSEVGRLNDQISNLLQRIISLNDQNNQEKQAKQDVMEKMNQQNLVIENLRKELTENQVKLLQISQQNNYLKDQITKIDEMSLAKQRQIQDKYIKEQIQTKYYNEKIQNQNHSLLSQIKTYQQQIRQYDHQIQALKVKSSRVSKSNQELNEQRLMGQIKNLQDDLLTQKQKENIIKEKYTRIVQDLEDKIKESQIDNRKMKLEIRKLENQINQYKNSIQEIRMKKSQEQASNIQIQKYKYQIRSLQEERKSYQKAIFSHEETVKSLQQRLSQLQNNLQQKMEQLQQKEYLTVQLHKLQQKHEQLLEQVKKMKNKNNKIQSQTNLSQVSELENNRALEIKQLKAKMFQQEKQIYSLKSQCHTLQNQIKTQKQQKKVRFQNMHLEQKSREFETQKILKIEIQRLTDEVNKFIQWRQKIQRLQQSKLLQNYKKQLKCQNCQNVLRQFLIYKQLQQIKMDYILDNFKSDRIPPQNLELLRQKVIFEGWIQQYDKNQQNYRVLQQRVWEWQKLKQNYEKGSNQLHKIDHNKNYSTQKRNADYLHQVQYELNLIKIQNSSLRGQIQSLQHQVAKFKNKLNLKQLQKHSQQKYASEVQIKLMKQDNRFLQSENNNLKHQISQMRQNKEYIQNNKIRQIQSLMDQKQKQISNLKRQLRDSQTTIQSLQNQYEHQLTLRSRISQEHQSASITHHSNNHFSQPQYIDRQNLPYEYIKYHPQHKKLQNQYIQLKRAYLQLELHNKKERELFEDELKKLQLEINYHKSRILQLQNQLNQINNQRRSLISVNHTFGVTSSTYEQIQKQFDQLKQNSLLVENELKIKTQELKAAKKNNLELISKYQNQKGTHLKYNQEQWNKKERTISQSSNMNIGKFEVSPIKSPSWNDYEHIDQIQIQNQYIGVKTKSKDIKIMQIQQQCQLLKGRINKYNEDVQKLKQIIDSKIVQMDITPREPTNALSRAIWFIERISTDIKQLKIDLQILKGQKKALIKQKTYLTNQIRKLEEFKLRIMQEKSQKYNQDSHNQNKRNKFYQNDENKYKVKNEQVQLKGKIPKLNLAENNDEVLFSFQGNHNINQWKQIDSKNEFEQNLQANSDDVLNQAGLLKEQRRNKLNMFKLQLMKQRLQGSNGINNLKVH